MFMSSLLMRPNPVVLQPSLQPPRQRFLPNSRQSDRVEIRFGVNSRAVSSQSSVVDGPIQSARDTASDSLSLPEHPENNQDDQAAILQATEDEVFAAYRDDPQVTGARDEGASALHIVIMKNDRVRFNNLIAQGADVNAGNPYGVHPLHMAAYQGRVETVTALLNAGANVEARTRYGLTPLHVAAYWGNLESMMALLAAHANKEARTLQGLTPLHMAALQGNTDEAGLLLTLGAEKESIVPHGHTSLHLAASRAHLPLIQKLLQVGANPNARDLNNQTPYAYLAPQFRPHFLQMVRLAIVHPQL